MSVNYSATVLDNRLQQVINAVDGGASSGFLRLLDGSNNVLSSLQLSKPSMSIVGTTAVFNGLSLIDPAAIQSGTSVAARVEDSAGNQIITGLTVGTGSTSDIIMSPTNIISAGQTIAITAATITAN